MKKLITILLFLFIGLISYGQPYADTLVYHIDTTNTISGGDSWPGMVVRNTTDTSLVIVENGFIQSASGGGYQLVAGDDLPAGRNESMNGAIIQGMKFKWVGTEPTTFVHGILEGYSINYHTRYNYSDSVPIGIILEGIAGMTYTEGGLYSNVFRQGRTNSVVLNGQNGYRIYGNTFYGYSSNSAFIKVALLTQVSPTATSNYAKVKNNIFYSKNNKPFIIIEDSCITTFECDFNVYYCEDGVDNKPRFQNGTTFAYYSWAEWQALGFDLNSVIIDPNFIDTEYFVPTARLDYATDLGSEYNKGLSPQAEWTPGLPPGLVTQEDTWQNGAYVYPPVFAYDDGVIFISQRGDDDSLGTSLETAVATFGVARDKLVNPGDSMMYAGGGYIPDVTNGRGMLYNPSSALGIDGTAALPVVITNLPGETPIYEGSSISNTSTTDPFVYMFKFTNADHVIFKGITLQNLDQRDDTTDFGVYDICIAYQVENCDSLDFTQNTVKRIAGIGLRNGFGTANSVGYGLRVLNNDWKSFGDTLAADDGTPGSYGSAISFSGTTDTTGSALAQGNRIEGAADQGGTFPGGYLIEVYDNWIKSCGGLEGEGHGMKFSASVASDSVRKYVRGNSVIHTGNPSPTYNGNGMTTNDNGRLGYFIEADNNNFLYGDRLAMQTYSTVGGTPDRTFRNNVSLDNATGDVSFAGDISDTITNSWQTPPGITPTADSFESLDTALFWAPRQLDGSLPDNGLFRLKEGSNLEGVGTAIPGYTLDAAGKAWNDPTRAIGAYEATAAAAIRKNMVSSGKRLYIGTKKISNR